MSDNSIPNVDHAAFQKLQKLFGEGFQKVWTGFLENTETYLGHVTDGIQQHQRQEILAAAHKITSSTGQFGMIDVQHLAKKLEEQAHTASEAEIAELHASLKAVFLKSVTILNNS